MSEVKGKPLKLKFIVTIYGYNNKKKEFRRLLLQKMDYEFKGFIKHAINCTFGTKRR